MRVVIDTNILVAAAYAPGSASRRIVEACIAGRLTPLASSAVRREYETILARAVRVEGYDQRLEAFLGQLVSVEPPETPRVVPEDPEDDKFLAAAVAGDAAWLVTNDRHVLSIRQYRGVRIGTPGQFANEL